MNVLILTGACGVGKSTIAMEWAKSKQGAIVDSDYFTEWIFKDDFPHWSEEEEKLTAKISAKVAIEYLKFGMPVAIENVWTPVGIEIMLAELVDYQIKVVHLYCALDENRRRDLLRIPDHRMGERVEVVKKQLAAYKWEPHVHPLDTSNLTVEETLKAIEALNFN